MPISGSGFGGGGGGGGNFGGRPSQPSGVGDQGLTIKIPSGDVGRVIGKTLFFSTAVMTCFHQVKVDQKFVSFKKNLALT